MRAFLQKIAGATYFQNSNLTVSIRKSTIEFIFALKGGWHAVVNLIVNPAVITILANLVGFTDKLDEILPEISFSPEEMPKLSDLLQGNIEFQILHVESDTKDGACGIGLTIPNTHTDQLQIIGDSEVLKAASGLVNYILSLYHELSKTDKTTLRPLTNTFYS